uniref:Metalloproteinase inhibitor 2 n=1 Tax=Hucho hucho TaxID=62062 RepID=A0A4W5QT36_9TELE
MTWFVSRCFISLFFLFLWRVDEIAEACTCMIVHPQQAFCNADIGKANLATFITSRVSLHMLGCLINYQCMFKGPNRDIHVIFSGGPSLPYTTFSLQHIDDSQSLSAGRLNTDGTVHVIMCDFIQSWDALSDTQMSSLTLRYQSGCDCTIIRCNSLPCPISAPDECLWINNGQSGPWAKNVACIKGGDGSCAWYKGMELPKK